MRLFLLIFLFAPAICKAQEKVAFFGLTLLDTSLQTTELGQDPAELERLAAVEKIVADRFEQEGYVLLELDPVRKDIDRYVNLAKCYGCDTRIATKLGADFALVGEVQKTSNLILSMNLQLRAADTGELVKGGVVEIRGNNDESWYRGMRYILKNRFFVREKK
ncbi:DUF3280 domain-containing protein [uncultured Roseobacter sp.]|uniref:DUF3280 domain-containing protein n=1 Tax=uncultured Roseobacter sp. TaxID=114847 RepID=UPI002626592F|nr:DUF3280 domain-containing protein [uncultured Roseobacter sp.]